MSFEDYMIDDGFNDSSDYMDYLEGITDDYYDFCHYSSDEGVRFIRTETKLTYTDKLATLYYQSKGISDVRFSTISTTGNLNNRIVDILVSGTNSYTGATYEVVISPGYYANESDINIIPDIIEDVILRIEEKNIRLVGYDWDIVGTKKPVWTYIASKDHYIHFNGDDNEALSNAPWMLDPHSFYSTLITEEDKENSMIDDQRVRYSQDGKKLLQVEFTFSPEQGDVDSPASEREAQITRSLKSCYIREGVAFICDSAFKGVDQLEEITLPDSILRIGLWAFEGCSSISEIIIPKSVLSMGLYAFMDCSSLKKVTFEASDDSINRLKTISYGTFSNCCSLDEVHIPGYFEKIESDAFRDCTSLCSLVLPESINNIGSCAFYGCTALNRITLPKNKISMGKSAFSGCSSLEKVQLSSLMDKIEDRTFRECKSLKEISIPSSVSYIGEFAFAYCESLKTITILNPSIDIHKDAFRGCSSLEIVYVPHGKRNTFADRFGDIVVEMDF